MEKFINIYLYGKEYKVPDNLTILQAFEYSGYQLKRGVGCRNGHCGACVVFYRILNNNKLFTALACQTKVENNMYVATLPYFPIEKKIYNLNDIKPSATIMMQLYPEIYRCIGCNSCSKACPQNLNVMQYISYAQRGEFNKVSSLSFDCVMCGICSSRCPANISHCQVAMLSRRLNAKYLTKESENLSKMLDNIENGIFDNELNKITSMSNEDLIELYKNRSIEK